MLGIACAYRLSPIHVSSLLVLPSLAPLSSLPLVQWVFFGSGLAANMPSSLPASPTVNFDSLRRRRHSCPRQPAQPLDPALAALGASPGSNQFFGHTATNVCGHVFLFAGAEGTARSPVPVVPPPGQSRPPIPLHVSNQLRVLDTTRFLYHDPASVILEPPPPCHAHTAVLCGSHVLVYGGLDAAGHLIGGCSMLDVVALVAPLLANCPTPPGERAVSTASPSNSCTTARREIMRCVLTADRFLIRCAHVLT